MPTVRLYIDMLVHGRFISRLAWVGEHTNTVQTTKSQICTLKLKIAIQWTHYWIQRNDIYIYIYISPKFIEEELTLFRVCVTVSPVNYRQPCHLGTTMQHVSKISCRLNHWKQFCTSIYLYIFVQKTSNWVRTPNTLQYVNERLWLKIEKCDSHARKHSPTSVHFAILYAAILGSCTCGAQHLNLYAILHPATGRCGRCEHRHWFTFWAPGMWRKYRWLRPNLAALTRGGLTKPFGSLRNW